MAIVGDIPLCYYDIAEIEPGIVLIFEDEFIYYVDLVKNVMFVNSMIFGNGIKYRYGCVYNKEQQEVYFLNAEEFCLYVVDVKDLVPLDAKVDVFLIGYARELHEKCNTFLSKSMVNFIRSYYPSCKESDINYSVNYAYHPFNRYNSGY